MADDRGSVIGRANHSTLHPIQGVGHGQLVRPFADRCTLLTNC